ncbi:hypothetical protein BLOT_013005 [Blomia tropicalis]|nr:hypothetical protein BLOT_013005 [Blomia tropicalis]
MQSNETKITRLNRDMYVKHIVTSKLSDQNLNYKSNKRKIGKSNHRDKNSMFRKGNLKRVTICEEETFLPGKYGQNRTVLI